MTTKQKKNKSSTNDLSPFDFIASVTDTKKDLIYGDDVVSSQHNESQYQPFIVNRGLALFADTVLYANEINTRPHLPKAAQYLYYLAAIRRRKRWSKWPKSQDNDDLVMIQTHFGCNKVVAKQYLNVLTAEQIAELRQQTTNQ